MSKALLKSILCTGFVLMAIIPSKAGPTSTISIQLERVSDGFIVSGDDTNPGTFTGMNDVLSFGTVTPLGIGATTTFASSRGASGTTGAIIQSFVIDTARNLYDPIGNIPKGNNDGAIYIISGALQIRAMKDISGVSSPSDVDVSNDNSSNIPIIVAPGSLPFTVGSSIPNSSILPPSAGFTSLTTSLANNATFPITIGIHVPFTSVSGTKTATLIFRAT